MISPAYYQDRVHALEAEYAILKRRSTLFVWLRFGLFLCLAASLTCYFVWERPFWLIALFVVLLVMFVVLVLKHNHLEDKITIVASKTELNKEEIRILNHDFHHRKAGNAYESIDPFMANDFTLFGKGSLFQFLNRCNTDIGRDLLAGNLCHPEKDLTAILNKQSAIRELSEKNDFIQEFQSHSRLIPDYANEILFLKKWMDESEDLSKAKKYTAAMLGGINIIWLSLASFGILSWSTLVIPVIVSLIVSNYQRNQIAKSYSKVSGVAGVLEKYLRLFQLIEDEVFMSGHLNSLKENLITQEKKASTSFKSFLGIFEALKIRDIALLSFLLNVIVFWDTIFYSRLLTWKKTNKGDAGGWFSALAEMEVLISFASYAFNHGNSVTYPTFNDEFRLEFIETGHPLIKPDVRVDNDFLMNGSPSVQIITGANMAGKSTFLRTLAVNLIVAMNGAPVIAKQATIFPCGIISSIKIQDSLVNNESYFYAELSRLRSVIDEVAAKPGTIVILDEILRGTNTRDKQTGTQGLLKKLINLNAMVVIATHDLSVGELENSYPGIAFNSCFEVELAGDDQLSFDYKLKPGISGKLNASFLMRKMEIID